jgi:hypothetical protein
VRCTFTLRKYQTRGLGPVKHIPAGDCLRELVSKFSAFVMSRLKQKLSMFSSVLKNFQQKGWSQPFLAPQWKCLWYGCTDIALYLTFGDEGNHFWNALRCGMYLQCRHAEQYCKILKWSSIWILIILALAFTWSAFRYRVNFKLIPLDKHRQWPLPSYCKL